MEFAALVSGGKDSIYSICKLIDEGNKLVAILHIAPAEEYTDSYMFQTVGTEVTKYMSQCLEVNMYTRESSCNTIDKNLEYTEALGDEVEDLCELIKTALREIPFQAVCSGAIHSVYQKNRVENICERLGLKSLTPLWRRDQKELLQEMIDYGIEARIVKVASPELGKRCLNMTLSEIMNHLETRNSKYGTNYCGEGGEYESIVLDCKHFKRRLECKKFEIFSHPEENGREDGVYYLKMEEIGVVEK